MAQDGDGAAGHHCQGLHVICERIDLHAVDLIAGKRAAQGVYADVLRLDVACSFVQLLVQRRGLDLAALAYGTERRVLAQQTPDMQPSAISSPNVTP